MTGVEESSAGSAGVIVWFSSALYLPWGARDSGLRTHWKQARVVAIVLKCGADVNAAPGAALTLASWKVGMLEGWPAQTGWVIPVLLA